MVRFALVQPSMPTALVLCAFEPPQPPSHVLRPQKPPLGRVSTMETRVFVFDSESAVEVVLDYPCLAVGEHHSPSTHSRVHQNLPAMFLDLKNPIPDLWRVFELVGANGQKSNIE